MFLALRGERTDGHLHIKDALAGGAVAICAEDGDSSLNHAMQTEVLTVRDTHEALSLLTTAYRKELSSRFVAITGSNGKTTTKDILGRILSCRGDCVWSKASYNNHVGVPLTILEAMDSTRHVVCEAGSNHPGELAPLLEMISPEIGILTSLGQEHLEHFGDMDGVVKEESQIALAVRPSGLLIVNGDSPRVDEITQKAQTRVVTVGFDSKNDVVVYNTSVMVEGTSFHLRSESGLIQPGKYQISHSGSHHAVNASLAMVAAGYLDYSEDEIRKALLACKPSRMRSEWMSFNGTQILNDAYNANPESMRAALATIAEIESKGRKIAVLGGMAELGAKSHEAHLALGRELKSHGIEFLISVGESGKLIAEGARSAGGEVKCRTVGDVPSASVALAELIQPGDTILIKASRSVGLEQAIHSMELRGKHQTTFEGGG